MTHTPVSLESPGSLQSLGRVHFIGIGGVGMSAVARIMVSRGVPVSGSDAKDLPVMHDLAKAGAGISVGYDASNLGDAQTIVAGSAIREDNPELAAARAQSIQTQWQWRQALAQLSHDVGTLGIHGEPFLSRDPVSRK